MINLNIETHYLKNEHTLAEYLIQSIFIHYGIGKMAIVTPEPESLAQQTKKEWQELYDESAMSLRFSSEPPEDILEADVTFAILKSFLKVPPICQILYITYPIERKDLYMITSWMPVGSKVIQYSFKP